GRSPTGWSSWSSTAGSSPAPTSRPPGRRGRRPSSWRPVNPAYPVGNHATGSEPLTDDGRQAGLTDPPAPETPPLDRRSDAGTPGVDGDGAVDGWTGTSETSLRRFWR